MKGVDGYEVGSHQRNFSQCFISMLTAGFASSTLCPTSSCRALLNVALRAGLRSAERKISSRWPLALCPFQDSMQQGSGIDQLQRPVYLSHKLRFLSTCPQGNSESQSAWEERYRVRTMRFAVFPTYLRVRQAIMRV